MMKDDKFLQFEKVDEQTTELFIYGDIRRKDFIDMWFGDDESRVDAFSFKDALNAVDTPNLKVRINSYGGSVSEGLAIYGLLSEFKGNLITIVDGYACSAASVIFMAGKTRIVPENGLLMIHNAWTECEGDSNALRKRADDLEKITQPSLDIYVSKTGLAEEKVKEMMDNETWITSKEAFELGFATSIEKADTAKQALEANYIHKLVMKIKKLQEAANSMTIVQTATGTTVNGSETYVEPNNTIKEDAWASFFNTKK